VRSSLDRDGVIDRAVVRGGKPYPPNRLTDLEIPPGVPEALERLHCAGFYLVVITNQPDVERGTQTREVVEALHAALRAQLPLDDFRVCFHDNGDQCNCRKPNPGLLLDGAREFEIELSSSFMVGDRGRDIEAGQRAGCVKLFIDHHYTESQPSPPFVRVRSLNEASEWILPRGLREQNEDS
jgi:D-glycero-D-manno-heptose 1,7-bisphosphate phosphatase